MKVLLVTTSYPLRNGSVSGVFIKKLVDHLKKYTEIIVVTPGDDKEGVDSDIMCAKYAPRRMQVLAHRPGGIPVSLRERPLTWLLLPSLLISMFWQCASHCRDKDAIIANWSINGVLAGVVAKLFNIPLITVLHGSDVNANHGENKNDLILSLAIKFSEKIVCVSDEFYREMQSSYSTYKDKFVMISNGVDGEYLNIEHSQDDQLVMLTTIGNLNVKKGVHIIIEAIALLCKSENKVILNVIGDGPEKERLIKLSESLGVADKVNFVGVVPHSEIAGYLKNTSIFVFASYSEGRASVLLEAMASGLPIVASDIEANQELIQHEKNGYLFKTGSWTDLSLKLTELISSQVIRKRLGLSAREYIDENELLWSVTGEKYNQLLVSCVGHA